MVHFIVILKAGTSKEEFVMCPFVFVQLRFLGVGSAGRVVIAVYLVRLLCIFLCMFSNMYVCNVEVLVNAIPLL